MTLCAVKWCAALATDGEYCPVHVKHPTLHPEYLAADEEFVADMAPCEECNGDGDCPKCNGEGECFHYGGCSHCGADTGHECGACEGSGKCHPCNGEGRVTHRKKADAA